MSLHQWQWVHLAEALPRNYTIDGLSDEDAHQLTCSIRVSFGWRIPEVITTHQQNFFIGEEILIIRLSRWQLVTQWMHQVPGFFRADIRRWSEAFRWFVTTYFIFLILD
jgi:hypothetical protein